MDTLENAQRRAEYWKAEHAAANDEIERLHEVLIRSRRTVDQARDHFLAGAEEDGWTLCALRLALDILDEGLGTRISENG